MKMIQAITSGSLSISKPSSNASDGTNELLAVGVKRDRSYIVRNGKIGVFASDSDGGLEYRATLSDFKNKAGRRLVPKQASASAYLIPVPDSQIRSCSTIKMMQ